MNKCSFTNKVICSDVHKFIETIPDKSIDLIISSPPYFQQRDYGHPDQIGLEPSLEEYLDKLYQVFNSCSRIIKKDSSIWVNIGDSFNENTGGYFSNTKNNAPSIGKHRLKTNKRQKHLPRRSMLFIPHRFAIKMMDLGGWSCRNQIILRKKSCQPTSAKNRFTIEYEYLFMFSRNNNYYFDKEKIKHEPSADIFHSPRERRSIWDVSVDNSGLTGHIAPFSPEVCRIPILACSRENDIVFDPFGGSGSTAVMAQSLNRKYLLCDINSDYCNKASKRLEETIKGKSRVFSN